MRNFIFVVSILVSITINGNANDSLKIVSLQREVSNLKAYVSRLQQEDGIIRDLYKRQKADVDSILLEQKLQTDKLNTLSERVGIGLSETNKSIQDSNNSLSSSIKIRTILAVCGILMSLAMLGVTYFILRKKILCGSSSIDKIKAAQESLELVQKTMQEESVKLDSKLVELLEKQVLNQSNVGVDEPTDHTLALKVADEIVRIEINLSRMDESVRGYTQLQRAVERIRTNFLANGYEIVEMLGKPYVEGMKATANFVPDDTLKEGEQIITGIIKPQINYKGKMIQAAQITVSQNL